MPQNVEITNETATIVDEGVIRRIVARELQVLTVKRDWQVIVSIVSNPTMRDLNSGHLKRDYPTDVLSFPVFAFDHGKPPALPPGPVLLGEVVLNIDAAGRAANQAGHSVESEVQSLVAHGIRHLIGFHHPE